MSTQEETLVGLVEVTQHEAQVLMEAGYISMEMGQFKEAGEIFEGCAALLPRSDTPRIGLGNLYVTQGRLDDAIKVYQEALKVRDDSAAAHAFLGEAYLLKGQVSQGVASLEKSLELDAEGPSAELARSLLSANEDGTFNP